MRSVFPALWAAGLLLLTAASYTYAKNAGFHYDEFYFLGAAKNLAVHGEYATFANGEFHPFDPYLSTGPTVILPVALAFRIGGVDYVAARLVMVGFFLLLFVLMYALTSELYGRAAGLLACLFLLCVPFIWFHGLTVLGEVPAVVFFLAAVLLMERAGCRESRKGLLLLTGILLGFAALTKLVFFLAIAGLGVLVVWSAVRGDRRFWGFAVCAAASLAVMGGWELTERLIAGAGPYADLTAEFHDMFVRESGVSPWLAQGVHGAMRAAAKAVAPNFRGVRVEAGLGRGQLIVAIAVVFFQLGRGILAGGRHRVVHVFLGLFLGGYLSWFFLGAHAPWYRLLIPAYLLFGIHLAPFVVESANIVRQGVRSSAGAARVIVASYLVVGVLVVPLAQNTVRFYQAHQPREARADLRLVRAIKEQLREDSKIGYWGWWRAPDVSFFVPNRFFDISQPRYRAEFDPERDFVLLMRVQRLEDPASWRAILRLCRETLLNIRGNVLCRYGDAAP